MKKSLRSMTVSKNAWLLPAIGVALLLVGGCQTNPYTPNLFNPNYTSATPPTLTSISPTGSALAGVTTVTITGTGFSTNAAENLVFFSTAQATILQASATQLVMTAPILVADSVSVFATLTGSSRYSNAIQYKLVAAVSSFGDLSKTETPYGLTCDTAGNVYVSVVDNGTGVGIKEFSPAGVRSSFASTGGVTLFSNLKVGPGGAVYAARGLKVLYQIPAGGGTPAPWLYPGGGYAGGNIFDFDFDAQGNMWAAGNDVVITRIKSDKSFKTFPFVGDVKSVRVYSGYVYIAANTDTTSNIWRFPIVSSDSLGPAEKYFAFSTLYGVPGAVAYAITFSSDGYMYIGIDGPATILLVHPDKSWEPYYPGLFSVGSQQSVSFAWDAHSTLYLSRTGTTVSHTVTKINTQKTSAPYYGRQ